MGDMADIFKAHRRYAQGRRRENKEKSTALLVERGIKFESRNDGLHLMIETAKGRVNFYPSTGLFYGAIEGRGVFNLLKELARICVAQNAKNDTQTDLCCTDNTQDQETKE